MNEKESQITPEQSIPSSSETPERPRSKEEVETTVEEAEKRRSSEKVAAKKEVEQALSGRETMAVTAEKAINKKSDVTPHVKKQQYRATMRRVESKLPPLQRTFSRFVHADGVEAVSNVVSKTVARPWGLLTGAILGFAGLLVLHLFGHRIGFEYNSGSAFIVLVVLGWIVGILLEYIFGAFRRMHSR